MILQGPPTPPPSRECRYKLLSATSEFVMLLMGTRHTDEWYRVPVTNDLPPDVVSDFAVYDVERDRFVFRLYHPTFDVVESGHPIPEVHPTWRLVDVPRGTWRDRKPLI